MSAIWGSARQALAYLFSCRRGPRLSQPRYSNAPPSTGHHHLDHVAIGALLYGPNPGRIDPTTGQWGEGCGIVPGDDLDEELREWALDRDIEPSDRVLDVLTQLRGLLEHHGLKAQTPAPDRSQFVRWTYPDGTSGLRMRGSPSRC